MRVSLRGPHHFTLHTRPTLLQDAAFTLFGLEPMRVQQMETSVAQSQTEITGLRRYANSNFGFGLYRAGRVVSEAPDNPLSLRPK